jgi:hypothetical protein
MNARSIFAVLVLAGTAAIACTAAAHNPKLSSRYEYTIGDDIALRTAGVLRITAGIEEPTLVSYDRQSHDIVAEILGSTDNVEGAKREILGLVDVIKEEVVGYAKKQHNIDLTDSDVTLIYYVDSDQGAPEEVVRREKGRFVVPKAEDADKEKE